MMYSEYYVSIEPEEYIWDALGDGSVCMMLFLSNSYDFFLLGQPVFQGYYTIHDMTASTIGFAPLKGSGKKPLQKANIPDSVLQASVPPTFIQEYGAVIFLVICGLIAVFAIQPLLET